MFKWLGVSLLLVSLMLSNAPAAAQSNIEDVQAAVNAEIARLWPRTFTVARSNLVANAARGEIKTFSVFLEANSPYTAIALCIEGCDQLKFTIRDGISVLNGESSGRGTVSTIHFRPRRSEYYVGQLTASVCPQSSCQFHLAVLRELARAPTAPNAPEIQVRPPPQAPAPAAFNSFPNTDLVGSDLNQLRNVDEENCLGACRANAECIGYSFDKWNNWCFLKQNVTLLTVDAQSRSAIKSAHPLPSRSGVQPAIQRYRNRAFPGTESSATAVASYDECEGRCTRSEGCMAFTYFKKQKRCGVSPDPGTYVSNPDADSGAKRQPR
jgi:hypothetical protein